LETGETSAITITEPSSPARLDTAPGTVLAPIRIETTPSGQRTIAFVASGDDDGRVEQVAPGQFQYVTKPGDYAFRCLVHPMMVMHVVVKASGGRVQSASQLLKATAAELNSAVATAKKLDTLVPQAANTVYAGVGQRVPGGSIELMTFKPQKLQVKVGTTVTFQINSTMEPHNVVFGPAEYLKQSFKALDLIPMAPGSANQVWPFFFYGSDPAQSGIYSYSGTNHGNGFLATPLLGPVGTPLPKTFKITFTAPGNFKYICGLHGEDMNGEIDVVL
jgi:plastocyanin